MKRLRDPASMPHWLCNPMPWLGVLLAAGVVLRLRQFLFNRSFWHDETLLATAFLDRSVSELVFGVMADNQAAPTGYLLLVKLLTSLMGPHEWAMRLPSLLCGLAALWLAVPIARTVFPSSLARATFVGLMAVSPVLVYYSSEFKQYQGDVLCTLLVLWLTLRFRPERCRHDAALLAVVGALCIWFSHAVVFVLAGSGLVLWLEMARRREREAWHAVTAAGVVWLASFAAIYVVALRQLPHNSYLTGFWATSFAPLPPTSLSDLWWFGEAALGLVYLGTHHLGTAIREVQPGWFGASNFLLLALALAGGFALVRQSRRAGATAAVTLAATLGASALQQYPFRSRLILFLVPCVFLALAALVQAVCNLKRLGARQAMAMGLAAVTVWVPARMSAGVLLHPINFQDVRGALAYVAAHREPGDNIMLGGWSYQAYRFYAPRVGLADMPRYVYQPTHNELHNIRSTVRRICQDGAAGRTWVFATHQIVAHNSAFLEALSAASPTLFTYPMEGGAVFLHDFRTTAFCQRYRPGAGTAVEGAAHPETGTH
jgi:hypothetical protein